jgi:O-antigen/teichoic acid export membrane protein
LFNSNEELQWDAAFGILDLLFKLFLAISLQFILGDKLVFYGAGLAIITILIFIFKFIFCLSKYDECTFKFFGGDKKIFSEMVAFTGWNTFGSICGVLRTQGIAVILNLFLGPYVNAAYAIAMQIGGKLKEVSMNLIKALNPQIVKAESLGHREEMLVLSMAGTKYGAVLYSLVGIVFFSEAEYFLKIWLDVVPEYSFEFTRLLIILAFVNLLTIGLQFAIQAIGNIRNYQVVIGSTLLLTIPISYYLLKQGYPTYSPLIVSIVLEAISCIQRLIFLK